MTDNLVGRTEAAEMLQMSVGAFDRHRAAGRMPPPTIKTGRPKWTIEKLMRFTSHQPNVRENPEPGCEAVGYPYKLHRDYFTPMLHNVGVDALLNADGVAVMLHITVPKAKALMAADDFRIIQHHDEDHIHVEDLLLYLIKIGLLQEPEVDGEDACGDDEVAS